MNNKYKKYIEYIAKDIELPYLKSLEPYGLKQDEMDLVLSKIFNQTLRFDNEGVLKIADDGSIITTRGNYVYNEQGNKLYYENSKGKWVKWEYDNQGNEIYFERSNGTWIKREYDAQGNLIYYEDDDGYWDKREFDDQGNLIYIEDSDGRIIDNR